jgi:polyketide biosynthesis 3-hydroxy-3-methylglutaryl-CoA synthase-like enzyme PksG
MQVGIEALNVYCGVAKLDLELFAAARGLSPARFHKLLMREKSVAMPYEDAVSYAVNAARPLIAALSDAEKRRIELLITCTESGIDFSKSVSSYVHDYLELGRNCRQFEIKQACYSATAGLQTAVNFILSQTSLDAKALIIASDISRFLPGKDVAAQALSSSGSEDWAYAEPSSGAGAVALLVGNAPGIFQIDVGCSGYYGYEVMDTARPTPDSEFGDADTSLLSYLDCCENAYRHYQAKVMDLDYQDSFGYLAFHTPFGGMVKGAHRNMMRTFTRSSAEEIEVDFNRRVEPGLRYCQQVGNIMGGTLFLALAGTIDHGAFESPQRVGMTSYGSGCCSEFFSGVVTPRAKALLAAQDIAGHLAARHSLRMDQYERLQKSARSVAFGTRNVTVDDDVIPEIRRRIEARGEGRELLLLRSIDEFHRKYEWV